MDCFSTILFIHTAMISRSIKHDVYFMLMTALVLAVMPMGYACAVTLDELYGPIMPRGKMILNHEAQLYQARERGIHGNPSYSGFTADPETYSTANGFVLPLFSGADLAVSLVNGLPSSYDRLTKNNSDIVSSYQHYHADSFSQVNAALRTRAVRDEFELDMLLRHGGSDWNYSASASEAPSIFNYYDSDYQQVGFVWRFLPVAAVKGAITGLSWLERPLMDAGQMNVESGVTVYNGRVSRNREYFSPVAAQKQHYLFRTQAHAMIKTAVRFGVAPDVELKLGLGYKTPFKYKYSFELYNQDATSQQIQGAYSYGQWIEVPLEAYYRPSERLQWAVLAALKYVNQDLDYWDKSTAGLTSRHPQKKLDFYQIRPALVFKYLSGPLEGGQAGQEQYFRKKLLRRSQSLTSLEWRADASISDRNESNGAQNLADPYDVYRYPLEYFMSGTEYGAFLSGNNGTTPAQIEPQGYHEFRIGVNHGFTNTFNMSLFCGYRTRSRAHQFSLGDLSERYYKFHPYAYIDGGMDWRIFPQMLWMINAHYVPDYRTAMYSSLPSTPEEFKDRTAYIMATSGIQLIF